MSFVLKLALFSGLLALVAVGVTEGGAYEESICYKGSRQSPINIPNPTNVKKSHVSFNKEYYKYHVFEVDNENGKTFEGELENGKKATVEGPLMEGEKYIFDDFQFKWDTQNPTRVGSDHRIGMKPYAAEMQLMHYNSKYKSFEDAIASGDPKALMFISILFELSPTPNPDLEPITKLAKKVVSPEDEAKGTDLNLVKLLFNGKTDATFAHYLGSLPQIGCEEVVMWNVKTTPSPISMDQLQQFAKLKDNHGKALVKNWRSLRPSNNRQIDYYYVKMNKHAVLG